MRVARALLVLWAAASWPLPAAEPARATAGIRIDLPAGVEPRVEVHPGPDRVVLDLPAAAEFPADFVAASGGLLRAATVETAAGRVQIVLELGEGYLERVSFEPGAVVLEFEGRHGAPAENAAETERYEIGPDDKIRVTVHNQTELSGSLVVGREGTINAPLVGEVQAAGLTPRELSGRLAERYGRTYLVDPRVDVEVEEYRSQWVMVGGEVRRPGRVPLRGGTRLKEVLGEAEGFTEMGGAEITISRRPEDSTEVKTLRVSREDYDAGRTNPRLAHGDLVEVLRADSCYVQGEVRDGGQQVRIERGMTLLRALAMAGGLTEWANRKLILVRHRDGSQETYNLNRIEDGAIDDPPLRGGEVIIVKKRFL